MLNPASDKYRVDFGVSLFPDNLTKDYNNYLFIKNGPIKSIRPHITESLQSISIPGFNAQTIEALGLNNLSKQDFAAMGKRPVIFTSPTISRTYVGNASLNEIIDSKSINLTFRNTVINWMYFYGVMRGYYDRTRTINDIRITITVMDAAEIEMLQFVFSDCFIGIMPGLEFSFNSGFREAKTIDVGFIFNKFDVNFLTPKFNVSTLNLKK